MGRLCQPIDCFHTHEDNTLACMGRLSQPMKNSSCVHSSSQLMVSILLLQLLVQLATHLGAHVIGTTSTEAKVSHCHGSYDERAVAFKCLS